MSQPRKSHTLEIIDRRMRDVPADAMELAGIHDELARVERKWIEQTRAGSDRRRPNDREKMDAYFSRLNLLVAAALRRTDLDPQERSLLEQILAKIKGRPAEWLGGMQHCPGPRIGP
jgi:hypothetical protein